MPAAIAAVVAIAGAACSSDSTDTGEPTGDASAFETFETRWSSTPPDERLLQCRVFAGELPDGPTREELHEGLTQDDAAIADLSFDDWSAFMIDACR